MNGGDTPSDPVTNITAPEALRQAMIGQAGPAATGWTGSFDLPPAPSDTSVLILGAGIAGLTAAYELSKRGYKCTVLEAQSRVGGRNRSGRRGDVLYEINANGQQVQTHECTFDDGLYLNLGPGRIPYHHRRVLKYCTDFNVALEPYIMETTANLISLRGGTTRWRRSQVANDTRGHLAALLHLVARLSEGLVGMDTFTEEVQDLLRLFGDLERDGEFTGSTRSGYDLGIFDVFPQPRKPLAFEDLVNSGFWRHRFYQPVDYLWQPTLFQPVGGMDKLVDAFSSRIRSEFGEIVTLEADVFKIELREQDVQVTYKQAGRTVEPVTADYCMSSIPLPILRGVELKNFSDEFKQAIAAVDFAKTCKVGWQANERFWEDDNNQIYGGISWTDHNITQIWYPSNDYFTGKGTLTGAYNFDDNADELGRMLPPDRLRFAQRGARELHPQFADDRIVPLGKGVSIAWHKVPYQLGGWAAWDPENADHPKAYNRLLQGESNASDRIARFYVIGDQISPLDGWMEGAMMSAQYVGGRIGEIVPPVTVSDVVQVPDSVALTQGKV